MYNMYMYVPIKPPHVDSRAYVHDPNNALPRNPIVSIIHKIQKYKKNNTVNPN